MPMHDWTKVEAGIYHALHHRWISAISDALNSGLLPNTLYALPEQAAAGFGPDVLTLQAEGPDRKRKSNGRGGGVATEARLRTRPRLSYVAEAKTGTFERKKSAIAVRHVTGDKIVAMI